ncbi:hypothetical protein [Microbispora sp. NPDC049125]|uniref:hypothetical protein n=1 Tax=Microbispora sp. NPDC049125 TaxID=3154929 RepID=UPI00346766F2
MITASLRRALTDPGASPLRPLPLRAARLPDPLEAPPRLGAHRRFTYPVTPGEAAR